MIRPAMSRLRAWTVPLLLGLLLLGLLPRGYMPGEGQWLSLCTESGRPAWVRLGEDGERLPTEHEPGECPWASAPQPAPAPPVLAATPPAVAAVPLPAEGSASPRLFRFLPQQPRAPPRNA
ncbi:MAG: hypothetical protein KatS3mg125_0383 [Lysobacterales bacterium]|jgi:hypothetical protein|nr:MAG: hypothetical protein KatS3mg125_0383 [Xanthomonadales bacterium]